MDFLIGGIAGAVSRTLTAPLELLKIQGQNTYMPNTSLQATIEKEGIKGLWKGNFTNCLRIFPQMAINYSVYSAVNDNVINYLPTPMEKYRHFISGALAGVISMSVIYPLENARSRLSLQTHNSHYKGLVDVFRKTPLVSLYNGLRMSIIGFAPYSALSYGFFNLNKTILYADHDDPTQHILPHQKMICGGLAGLMAVSFTYPTDLIRRRLQLQGFDSRVPKYDGIKDCISKIVRKEGVSGLYKGLSACYLKIFPATAIQFLIITYNTYKAQQQ